MKAIVITIVVLAIGLGVFLLIHDSGVRAEARQLREDVKDLGHDAKNGVREGYDATKDAVKDGYKAAEDAAK